ncbi:MAG TPA: hypothetical protein DCE07_08200 [Peptococcaceae bacterium]|nr:hypothetical protein [Peptococcaceae bacterium]
MENKGKIKMLFPGGNTCLGFYSFYDNIIDEDAKRVFILKGGPGTGKSTLMQQVAEEMQKKGYDLEFHWCSSDPDSLDAVVIPELKVALIDGTAPHMTDPRYPGAVEEIINLGDCWDEKKLKAHRQEIILLVRKNQEFFATAYSNLRMAKTALDEEKALYDAKAVDEKAFISKSGELLEDLFGTKPPWGSNKPRERHLFGWAITPAGIVDHLSTILGGTEKLFLIQGCPGSGTEKAIKLVAEIGYHCGFACEVYHCAFDPEQIDLVVFPEMQAAVLKMFLQLKFDPINLPGLKEIRVYDFATCIAEEKLESQREQLEYMRKIFKDSLNRAISSLKQAKEVHDQLESFYVQSVDYQKVEQKRKLILEKILSLTQTES